MASSNQVEGNTPIQQNLVNSNEQYASSFNKGHLALPPAKRYLVGKMDLSTLQKPSIE